jgi:hypothetical protein
MRGANQQRAAARGMGGALSSQMADLQSQQGAINSANSNAVDIAGQNRQRYMQALAQMGSQAGAVRGQDQAKASAQNQINQFNTGMRWQAQQYNLNVPQRNWENQMTLEGKRANAMSGLGQNEIDKWKAKYNINKDTGAAVKDYAGGMWDFASSMMGGA